MSYFSKILDGNIPLSVVESIQGLQENIRLNQTAHVYKIEHMSNEIGNYPIDYESLLNSPYGKHIQTSLELNHEKVLLGTKQLLTNVLKDVYARNKVGLSKAVENKQVTKNLVNQVSYDLANSVIISFSELKVNEYMKELLLNIIHLTGITNKTALEMDDIEKKTSLLLELHNHYNSGVKVNIMEILNNQLTINNMMNCGSEMSFECVFDNSFINNLSIKFFNSLESILSNTMKSAKHDKVSYFYLFSVELSNALVNNIPISQGKLVENFGFMRSSNRNTGLMASSNRNTGLMASSNRNTGLMASSNRNNGLIDNVTTTTNIENRNESIFKNISNIISSTNSGNNIKPKYIEGFGITAGNKDSTLDSTKIKDLKEIEKNIDQSKVLKGMTKMISSAVNNAVSKNQADLLRSIAASNKINLKNAKGTSFTFTKIKQSTTIDSNVQATFVQKIQNKIINDISNSLKEQIDIAQKESMKEMNKTAIDEKQSTSVGDVLAGVANVIGQTVGTVANAAASMVSINAGNTTEKKTEKEITQELKDKFNLNQSFQYQKDDDVENKLENLLKSENLSKCANDTKSANDIDLGEIDVTGPITISEITQEQVVKDIMSCVFNQEVINDIASKMLNSQDKLIKQLIENVSDKLSDVEKKIIQGDIYAAGTAGSAILASAGSAAKDIGQGVATGAKGIGEGIGEAFSGLIKPLIVAGVVLVVLIIGFMILKSMMNSSNSDRGRNDDDDEE